MIRPYLRDLLNKHKPTIELTNKEIVIYIYSEIYSDTERGEWKIQLVMQDNCISAKDFEETRTTYSASKLVEIFMGSNTDDAIDKIFDTLL